MKFFDLKKRDYTIIIGCGRLGANLANTLSNEGMDVLIMDESKDSFHRLDSNYGGLAVVGNGMEFSKLKEAQIDRASAVIAVTNDDNKNIMVAEIAREVFHVNKVIVRLNDPECETVYQELGIETICPSVLSIKEIDKILDSFPKTEAYS